MCVCVCVCVCGGGGGGGLVLASKECGGVGGGKTHTFSLLNNVQNVPFLF